MDWHKSAGGFISDCGTFQIVPITRFDNGNMVYRALRFNKDNSYTCIGIRTDANDAKELCDNYVSK